MNTCLEAEEGIPYGDIAVFGSVPVALAILYFGLASPIQETLVFDFHDPLIWTAWTASFIHHDEAHLVGNVLGYILAIVPSYQLFHHVGQRRRFWIAAGLIFVLTPFVTTAIDYWLLHLRWDVMAEGATSRGFSGIVTAFGGMLLAVLTVYLATAYDKFRAGNAAGVIVLVGLGLVANELGALSPFLIVLLSIGLLACLSGLIPADLLFARSKWPTVWTENGQNIVYATYSGAVVCLFMLTFIPSTGESGMFSNAIAHATGFTFGVILTFLVSIEN